MTYLPPFLTGRPKAYAIVSEGIALGISCSSNHCALSGRPNHPAAAAIEDGHILHLLSVCPVKSVFIGISIRLPRSTWWLNSLLTIWAPANSKRKSMVAFPKSTVDLSLELLIWGKNGLQTSPLPDSRHLFRSITMRELWGAGQIQTETDQKRNACQTMGRGQSLSSFKTL